MESVEKADIDQNELIKDREGKVVFTVKKEDMDENFINRFYDILKKHPGFDKIEFKVTGGNGKDIRKIYKLPSSFKINLSQSLKEDLRQVFQDKINWDRI